MSDMTEHAIGSIDAVADSLIEAPEVEETIEDEVVNEQVDDVDQQEESEPTDDVSEHDNEDVEQDDEELGSSTEELFYRVKVDGEEQEVSLDELTRSYSGQKYIQKGMQEAAEARKAVESEYQALQQQSQQLQQLMQSAQSGQLNLTPPTPPSRELFEQDPIGFMDQKLQYEEAMGQYQTQMQQVQQTMAQQQQLDQQASEKHLQAEMSKLSQDPDFSNPERAKQVKADMLEFAESIGFTSDEIRGITDHRAMLVLKNAALYAKTQKAIPQARKKAESARPYVKSGSAKKPQSSKAKKARASRDKMKQTGSIDDVANFLIS